MDIYPDVPRSTRADLAQRADINDSFAFQRHTDWFDQWPCVWRPVRSQIK